MHPGIKLAELGAPIVSLIETLAATASFGQERHEDPKVYPGFKTQYGPHNYHLTVALEVNEKAENGLGCVCVSYNFCGVRGSTAAIEYRKAPGIDGWLLEYTCWGHDDGWSSARDWLDIKIIAGPECGLEPISVERPKYVIPTDATALQWISRTSELFLEQIAKNPPAPRPVEE